MSTWEAKFDDGAVVIIHAETHAEAITEAERLYDATFPGTAAVQFLDRVRSDSPFKVHIYADIARINSLEYFDPKKPHFGFPVDESRVRIVRRKEQNGNFIKWTNTSIAVIDHALMPYWQILPRWCSCLQGWTRQDMDCETCRGEPILPTLEVEGVHSLSDGDGLKTHWYKTWRAMGVME